MNNKKIIVILLCIAIISSGFSGVATSYKAAQENGYEGAEDFKESIVGKKKFQSII